MSWWVRLPLSLIGFSGTRLYFTSKHQVPKYPTVLEAKPTFGPAQNVATPLGATLLSADVLSMFRVFLCRRVTPKGKLFFFCAPRHCLDAHLTCSLPERWRENPALGGYQLSQ